MKLYIVRHGETDWNNEKKLQGRSDVPLNDYGRELAYITAEALKDVSYDAIYSSPLIRAYETATILKGDRDIDIIKDERLREMCFGEYEGKHTAGLPQEFWYFLIKLSSKTKNFELFLFFLIFFKKTLAKLLLVWYHY